jgi:hypothetical protein
MRKDFVVQFVCFKTTLDKEQFINQWEHSRASNSDPNVTLQQSQKKDLFKYIAQHRCKADEFEFVFSRIRKSPRHTASVPIRMEQAGGYSLIQSERQNDADEDESKIFAFIDNHQADLDVYRQMGAHGNLNIYEAYYENCRYAYILEFFVKNEDAVKLLNQVKQYDASETGIYKECVLEFS